MLSDPEKRRYHRHIMLPEIGEEGQEKLKRSSVLVVGAGGLGAPVLQYLTAAGIGKIGIMDDDAVSEDNLHRQILYGGHDLGKLKTIIARERLEILNPFVEHEIINIRINTANALDFVGKYDLVIDATDNFSTRYLINDACELTGKPWIFGSVFRYEGQVSTFNFAGGPSIRSLYPEVKDKTDVPDPSAQGLLGVLPGIIGSFQAVEALKIITGIGETLSGKLLVYNMLYHDFNIITFTRNPALPKVEALLEAY
jgi:molybdopterin/thiamine biosynthesis adenylyltransferase